MKYSEWVRSGKPVREWISNDWDVTHYGDRPDGVLVFAADMGSGPVRLSRTEASALAQALLAAFNDEVDQ